ncbi:hypothetical protein AAG607_03390 [Citromicrobium bathyomarinum]|uniref:hypothetical protein n=1 Tax=Alteriqipengyuania sp. TaxID=2800692 RepID=UPI00315A0837
MQVGTILNATTIGQTFLDLLKGLPRNQALMLSFAHRDAPGGSFNHTGVHRLRQKLIGALVGNFAFAVPGKLRLGFKELANLTLRAEAT